MDHLIVENRLKNVCDRRAGAARPVLCRHPVPEKFLDMRATVTFQGGTQQLDDEPLPPTLAKARLDYSGWEIILGLEVEL